MLPLDAIHRWHFFAAATNIDRIGPAKKAGQAWLGGDVQADRRATQCDCQMRKAGVHAHYSARLSKHGCRVRQRHGRRDDCAR